MGVIKKFCVFGLWYLVMSSLFLYTLGWWITTEGNLRALTASVERKEGALVSLDAKIVRSSDQLKSLLSELESTKDSNALLENQIQAENLVKAVDPVSLRGLLFMIRERDEDWAIKALRLQGRGIVDVATVKGEQEIETIIRGRRYTFDVIGSENLLKPLMEVDILFSADFQKPLGWLETDYDLQNFKILRRPSEQELSRIPVTCIRCRGFGKEYETDTDCLTCGADGRLGEGTIFYNECPDCGGDGITIWNARIYESLCSGCNGSGKMPRPR